MSDLTWGDTIETSHFLRIAYESALKEALKEYPDLIDLPEELPQRLLVVTSGGGYLAFEFSPAEDLPYVRFYDESGDAPIEGESVGVGFYNPEEPIVEVLIPAEVLDESNLKVKRFAFSDPEDVETFIEWIIENDLVFHFDEDVSEDYFHDLSERESRIMEDNRRALLEFIDIWNFLEERKDLYNRLFDSFYKA